jgi:hypothetical protein
MDAMASSGKVKDDLPARRPYVPSGAPETTVRAGQHARAGQASSQCRVGVTAETCRHGGCWCSLLYSGFQNKFAA